MYRQHKIFLSVASFVSQSRRNSQCCKTIKYFANISDTNDNIFDG